MDPMAREPLTSPFIRSSFTGISPITGVDDPRTKEEILLKTDLMFPYGNSKPLPGPRRLGNSATASPNKL
jgi:hypothetical protein